MPNLHLGGQEDGITKGAQSKVKWGPMGGPWCEWGAALNPFYLRLYGVRHMLKDHSDSERGNPLPPHGLLVPISNKGSFICTIQQTG